MKKAMISYCVAGLILLSTAAEAKSPQQLSGEASKAYSAWQAAAAVAGAKGLPRLSDPAEAALIRAVFNLDNLIGISPVTGADVPHLLDACDKAKAVTKSYVFWSKDGSAPDTMANELTFPAEIALGSSYTVMCIGHEAEALQTFMASLPPDQQTEVRKQGIEMAREGMFQMVAGLSQMITQENYSNEQKLMLAHALQDAAPKFAAFSSREKRAALVTSLATAAAAVTEPALKTELESAISKINAID